MEFLEDQPMVLDRRLSKKFRRFHLVRHNDISGISGTGIVAEGILFTNNKVVLAWTGHHTSIAVYDSLAECEAVHGHEGSTVVEWIDE